jgi:hypothetical protein
MQQLRRNKNTNTGLSILLCLILAFAFGNAKLRGIGSNFDALKERATNPIIREDIRGKTLRDLGVAEPQSSLSGKTTNTARRTEDATTFNYFAVSQKVDRRLQEISPDAP